MSKPDDDRLRSIRTFPSLVKYLRDDLDWPIDSEDFEELTFDYTPDELGLDAQTAVNIKEVKQLRPLVSKQPWGVFFVNFEPKRLPVVVLRRVLRSLVLKKRQSSNKAHQAAWQLNDLLFISSYGEADHRDITFAHFAEEPELGDLPTLRVLGWDDEDTVLHLEHTDRELQKKLRWPTNAKDIDAWREGWSGLFALKHKEVVSTSKALAVRLANLATKIRKRANAVLRIESESGPFRKLYAAFRESLVRDLNEDDFADMYAQTICYGLLTARVSRPAGFVAEHLRDLVPVTNPFLKELLETFLAAGGRKGKIDFDELGVSEVVQMLRDAKMEDVLRDFGDRNPQEDPAIHFYELFLKEYDPEKRMQRGVFYTPRPVVAFIVRSVDEILRREFGLADGLADTSTWGAIAKNHPDIQIPESTSAADHFVQILDPAIGTGTFLVEVIEVIHRTMQEKWRKAGHMPLEFQNLWNEYVPKHLLPRLFGFELMMAPYAIAHMKIGLKLYETGYRFGSAERARVYLTNTLEPPHGFSPQLAFDAPALANEAQAVNQIKRRQHFTVIVGNPPYSSSISEPEWLMEKLEDWKRDLNETKSDLNREEWKFLRYAAYQRELSGAGILGFIINRDFLDGITKRRMREHLGEIFPLRIAIDLNGDVKGNIADENVFDIEQGVAIVLLGTKAKSPELRFCSVEGTRKSKYDRLTAKAVIDKVLIKAVPVPPYYRWRPFANARTAQVSVEYSRWFPVNDAFDVKSSGIQTKNDQICIAWTAQEMFSRVQRLAISTAKEARKEFEINDDGAWSLVAAQQDLKSFGIRRQDVRRILYRPFDWRFTFYTQKSGGFLGRPRYEVMQHMTEAKNIGLIFNRQIVGASISQFGVSRDLICHGTFYLGNKGQDYFAPLFLRGEELNSRETGEVKSNFTKAFVSAFSAGLNIPSHELRSENIFNYIYGIFHSNCYRERYGDLLKEDFPRLPLPKSMKLFLALSALGADLALLHLMESSKLDKHLSVFHGNSREVDKIDYLDHVVWIDKKHTSGFRSVPEVVWNFYFGGYRVCEKWLKDRKGRTLSNQDIEHYQRIIVALNETILLMSEVDKLVDSHGGWPGAFTGTGDSTSEAQ